MRSAIYEGTVVHRRHVHPVHGARGHSLRYRAFYLLLDLDELGALCRSLRWFTHNRRRAVFSFQDRDHGDGLGNLQGWVTEQLRSAGLDGAASEAGGRVELLCFPRVFGYVFNPISVYFCYAPDDTLAATIYEVNNTYRERHSYVIPASKTNRALLDQACDKKMYVSPFTPMKSRYRFRVRPPEEEVAIAIRQSTAEGPLLDASFTGRRRPLGDAQLARLALKFPLLTLKVMGAIHLEALKLWLKGLPVFRHGEPPSEPVTVVDDGARRLSFQGTVPRGDPVPFADP